MGQVHTLETGTLLKDKYEIVSVLAKGGFSTIYKGRDSVLETEVAIKQFVPEDGKEAVKNRILQEARHVAALSDIAELVQVRDYFEENGSVFMVMEYVDGVTLFSYVKKQKGRMSWQETAEIFKQVIPALERVHASGIIHRDISPENIMLLADGRVKILDFGALKYVGSETAVGQEPDNTTTALVKRGYAPVEQYQSRGNLGPWTDVYGVCATIYFCLTGETPPEAPGRAISREELEFEERGVELSPHVEEVLRGGMAVRVANRIKSMEELGQRLFADEVSEPVTEAAGDEKEKKSGPYGAWLRRGMIALAAAAAALAIFFVWKNYPVRTVSGTGGAEEFPEGQSPLYDGQELSALLEDQKVHTIVVPEGVHVIVGSAVLDKPVVVEKGAMLEVGYLELKADGHVQIDGSLNAEHALLRMDETTAGISVSASGELLLGEHTVLWTKDGGGHPIAYETSEPAVFPGKKIALDETAGWEQAVSVSNYEELSAARAAGNAVRVDGDIHFTEEFSFDVPVYVSEGVTITADDGLWLGFSGDVFINYGSIDVGFYMADGAFFINYGTLIAKSDFATSLRAEDGAMTFNMGTIEGASCSRLWNGAILYNVGTLEAYNFYVMGSTCFNYGSIQAKSGEQSFAVTNAGRLYNYGSFEAEEEAGVCNNGWVENAGSFIVGKDAVFDNNVFFNRGYFECALTSTLDRQSGIYYGNGEFSINGLTSVAVWKTSDWAFDTDYYAASGEEELREALKDNEVSKIFVDTPIHLTEDIEITKPLFLNAKLSADSDTAVCVKNTYAVLLSGGTLAAKTLSLDNSLLIAEEGTLDLTGAAFVMDNRSSFAANEGETTLAGSTVAASRRSVICAPFENEAAVEETSVVLEDSQLFLNRDVTLKNTDISLEKESDLFINTENLSCSAGTLTVEKDSTVTAQFAAIGLSDNTMVTNNGTICVDGWSDSSMTFSGTNVENFGQMQVYIKSTADETSVFYNEGTLDIQWADEEN